MLHQTNLQGKLHFHHVMPYGFKRRVSVERSAKRIQRIYLDRAPALRKFEKWFCRFRNGDSSKILSRRPLVTDNDLIYDLANNIPRITTVKITERLNVDNKTFKTVFESLIVVLT